MRTITLTLALFRLTLLRLAVAVPTVALFQGLAIAQTLDEEDLFSDLPFVISASRLNQSVLNSPSSVTVIDKAMIEASGFIEFVDLLRLAPGFQVAYADGRTFAAVYHGYGSDIANQIQVLVNGRSTYTPTLSTVEWDMLGVRIEDIERIEVVRGPSASAYGSNSFKAAINIITKAPELDDSANSHFRAGNNDERDVLLRYSEAGENISFRVTASQRKNTGINGIRDSRDIGHLGFHARINNQKNHPINLYLSYTDSVAGTDKSSNILDQRDREAKSWSAHITGSKILSATQEFKWHLYYNDDDIYDLAESIPLSNILGITPAEFELITGNPDQSTILGLETNDASKTDFEVEYSSSELKGIKYVVGAGIRYDTLTSLSYIKEGGEQTDTTLRLFGNGQIAITDKLTFNSGALYEHVQGYDTKLSPRASLNWQLSQSQSLRLAISRGYRFPSLLEKNFDTNTILSNGFVLDQRISADNNLEPEKIDNIELGYLGKFSNIPASWDIKLYKEKSTELIAFPLDLSVIDTLGNFARKTFNGNQSNTYGIEGEITYRASNRSFIKFLFNRGHTNSIDIRAINPDVIQTLETGIPKESYGLLAATHLNTWQFSLGVYHVGTVEWFNTGDVVDNYTRRDLSVSKTFKLGEKSQLKVKLAGQNIGNKYNEFDDKIEIEPRYYINFSITNP